MTVCRRWDLEPPKGGTAVVIDVLRFSTTICALLKAGRRIVRVCETPNGLEKAPEPNQSDAFSELDFRWPGRHLDNSPALALSEESSERPAYVTTTSGSRALWASRGVERVLVGGFANFNAVVGALGESPEPFWFVPAAPPVRPNAIEDELCAEAFRAALSGRDRAAEQAILRLQESPRLGEFYSLGIPTDREDAAFALKVDSIPMLPEADFPPKGEEGRFPFATIRRNA